MLYLPPAFAHDGVAVDACFTYSIGFRAPSHRELMSQFLIYLDDKLTGDGRYSDPDLRVQAHPAEIGPGMVAKVEHILGRISWRRRDVAEFLGSYLTEPKPHILFAPPRKPLSETAFSNAAKHSGLELALASQMLYGDAAVFINGESHKADNTMAKPLRKLADTRRLPARQIPLRGPVVDLLYRWYRAGYIYLTRPGPTG